MSGRWAKVVNVNPEAHSVDLVFTDNGERMPNVAVLSAGVSTNTGDLGLPVPTPPGKVYSAVATGDRDVWAATMMFGGVPVVIGFKVPEICQMTFKERGLKISRHGSDFYSVTDDSGNFELFHPSGTCVLINESGVHRDLTGLDFDKRWKIEKNVGKNVHFKVVVRSGGAEKSSFDMKPNGDIAVTHTGNLTVNTQGNVSATIGGNATVAVSGDMTSSAAAWSHTGDINVTGKVTASDDVIGGGKSLKTHTHPGNNLPPS